MSKTLEQLKAEAKELTGRRRHTLGDWLDNKVGTGSLATCTECKRFVTVTTNPMPNDIPIGGDALAMECGDIDSTENLLKSFELDDNGIIQCRGKFENESIATAYYWCQYLDGSTDWDVTTEGRLYNYWKITPADVDEIEDAIGKKVMSLREGMVKKHLYRIWTRDDGFVIGQIVDEEILEGHKILESEENENEESESY